MKKGFKTSMVLVAGLALALAGCGKNDQPSGTASGSAEPSGSAGAAEAAKLKVVTTFYPMYEFSKQVGGEYADVVALVPPGTEPHDWEPSPQDMVKVKEADIFVYNGLVEEWVEDALASAASDAG